METKLERVERFARIFAKSRYDAGKSQEYMAAELGVSRKTIQHWESGESSPSFFQGTEWFRALGLNPMPYYLEFVYPESFDVRVTDEKIEKALDEIIKDLSIANKRALLFLLYGGHGSSPDSVLQMVLAHLHTPIKDRVVHGMVIAHDYEIESELGNTICTDNILPNMDVLNRAIEEAKESAKKNRFGYVNMSK